MTEMSILRAVSPIDGRYHSKTVELADYLSEEALIKARVQVEVALFNALTSGALPDIPDVGDQAHDRVKSLVHEFTTDDAEAIKALERVTNHDVKAVELWMREQLSGDPAVGGLLEMLHFGVTSEDINNNAWNIMHAGALEHVILPQWDSIVSELKQKTEAYADMPLLSLTHGQTATPTTLGKEMGVFATRMDRTSQELFRAMMSLTGKLNGATGTYGAMVAAYPDVDWPLFTRTLVTDLGFEFNETTTQIEPHDQVARLFKELSHCNTQIVDLSRDMWGYISRHIFVQRLKEGEVGSSTMPHKVNPIDFENAEGNAGLAKALLDHMADKLPISRFQRDLSDSTVLRASGEAFGHTAVALASLDKGLTKVVPNEKAAREELDKAWEILAEPIQTVGRRYGVPDVYNLIKQATRGQQLDQQGYLELVRSLPIPDNEKQRLSQLTPSTYTGLAHRIARAAATGLTVRGPVKPEAH